MANANMHLNDDKVLGYLKENKYADFGVIEDWTVSVSSLPPVANGEAGGIVTVQTTYKLTREELEELITNSLGQ